jgi:hypothetical protein
MVKATTRMNEELDAAAVLDERKRDAANVRACRLAGTISRMSATYQQALLTPQRKRTANLLRTLRKRAATRATDHSA